MAVELKPLLLDETGKEMRDGIKAITDAIKNTDTVRKAKEEIQAEGATQVANVQAASEEIIGKVEQIDQNTQRIDALKGDLIKYKILPDIPMIEGNVWLIRTLSNGVIAGSINRIATTNFIEVKKDYVIYSTDYEFTVSTYSNENEESFIKVTDYVKSWVAESDCYIRLVSKRTDNGDIQTDDLTIIPNGIFMICGETIADIIDECKNKINNIELSAKIAFLSGNDLSEAIVIQLSNGINIGIDCGSYGSRDKMLSDYTSRGVTHLDYLIISHYHPDHVGGLSILTTNNIVDSNTKVYLPTDIRSDLSDIIPDYSSVKTQYDTAKYLLSKSGCSLSYPTTGQKIPLCNNCEISFWNTDHEYYYTHSTNYNDWSLCCDLCIGNNTICFTGDIGDVAQTRLAGTLHKATIYKANHHGWEGAERNLISQFINNVNPDLVICCDAEVNDAYFLTEQTPIQTWCEKNGISNYRTFKNNKAIDMTVDKYSYRFNGAYTKFIRNEKNWSFSN